MAGADNLKPFPERTVEEQREIQIKGGKASGEARRKKRLMSDIYGHFLAEKFSVNIDGNAEEMTGYQFVNRVMKTVLVKGGSPAVSLMREIREATEGSHLLIGNDENGPFNVFSMSLEEAKVRLKELEDEAR